MKNGVFYGVGVGPGDPELITLKAVRVLERCPVIAAPRTKGGGNLALDIAARAVSMEEKTILPLRFTMEREASCRRTAHDLAADEIARYLTEDLDVAMPTLGDVSIYASCRYLMELLRERDFEAVMIPGIPSFCAAARLGVSLTDMDAPLHIIPAGGRPAGKRAGPAGEQGTDEIRRTSAGGDRRTAGEEPLKKVHHGL